MIDTIEIFCPPERIPFMVGKHTVMLTSPVHVICFINVPWNAKTPIQSEEKAWIMNTTKQMIRYLKNERITGGDGIGYDIMIKYQE